ncbi:MAG: nucleoside triphosphate pyrophosphohydrolase [Nitrospirota bacterium]|nr:nucleoside triphosphate pyrophosphohydrolase [Nitrospirota bacterium]
MNDARHPVDKLVELMSTLRSPCGCPWDKEQTRKSLTPFLIEEAYEVVEAIEGGNPRELKDELGDLLFQIIFHCQIARERGEFDLNDVAEHSHAKMVNRHPHVFGDAQLETSADVLANWEEIKKKEEHRKRSSMLEGLPKELPALLKAHRVQDKAARVGFDWEKLDQVIDKVEEEVGEFRETLHTKDPEKMEEELGDVFFSLVNVSRFIGVNPEEALRKTISKFIHRFKYIEEKAAEAGKNLSEMTLEEMDRLWDEAKKKGA